MISKNIKCKINFQKKQKKSASSFYYFKNKVDKNE